MKCWYSMSAKPLLINHLFVCQSYAKRKCHSFYYPSSFCFTGPGRVLFSVLFPDLLRFVQHLPREDDRISELVKSVRVKGSFLFCYTIKAWLSTTCYPRREKKRESVLILKKTWTFYHGLYTPMLLLWSEPIFMGLPFTNLIQLLEESRRGIWWKTGLISSLKFFSLGVIFRMEGGKRFYCVFILFINFITLLTHSTAWWVSQYIAKGVINIIHFQQMEQLRKLQRIIETHPAVWGENSFVILSQASTALTRARATAHFSVLAESQVFLDLYSNFGL